MGKVFLQSELDYRMIGILFDFVNLFTGFFYILFKAAKQQFFFHGNEKVSFFCNK